MRRIFALISIVNLRYLVLDEQKTGVEKEAADLRASLREVEKARQEARNDIQEGRARIKSIAADRAKLGQNLEGLQERLGKAELREEDSRKEIYQLRQKVTKIYYFSILLLLYLFNFINLVMHDL